MEAAAPDSTVLGAMRFMLSRRAAVCCAVLGSVASKAAVCCAVLGSVASKAAVCCAVLGSVASKARPENESSSAETGSLGPVDARNLLPISFVILFPGALLLLLLLGVGVLVGPIAGSLTMLDPANWPML
jgi:hypothetical protein